MNTTSNKATMGRKLIAALALMTLLMAMGMQAGLAADAATALTIDDAKAISLEHAGLAEADVFITKLKTDHDDGRTELEVEFIAGDMEYEYKISAADGTIRKTSSEAVSAKKKSIDPSLYLGFEKAVEIALADAGFAAADVTITGTEFDFDDGRAEYEIEFIMGDKEYQYEMDATTGDILGQEIERVKDR